MSRYKKIITGEMELSNGWMIYPTIETRMDLLEHIKSSQLLEEIDEKDSEGNVIATKKVRGKFFSLPSIAKTCATMIFESCFNHNGDGLRVVKKEEEKDTTYEQILTLVLQSDVMSIYLEIMGKLDFLNNEKLEELRKGQSNIEKN